MGLSLIGFLFIAFDVGVTLAGNMKLEVPPDFLGYLLILIGMHRCREESRHFANARSFSWVGLILSGLWFGIKLTGIKNMPFSVPVIIELAELVVSIIVIYLLVAAIREQEELMQLRLGGKALKWVWIGYSVLLVLSYVLQLFGIVGIVVMMVSDLMAVPLFFMLFNAFGTLQDFD